MLETLTDTRCISTSKQTCGRSTSPPDVLVFIKQSGVGYEHLCALYRCSPWPCRITALHQLASPSDSDDCEVSLSWLEIVHIPIDLLSGRSGGKCYSGSWPLMLCSRHTGVRRSADDDMMDYSSHCQPSQNQSAADKVHAHSQPQALFVLLRQRHEVRVIGVVCNLQRMSLLSFMSGWNNETDFCMGLYFLVILL